MPHTPVSLSELNTFGISALAAALVALHEEDDLLNALGALPKPFLVLGGGSNVVFTKDWPGTILLNRIGGIEVVRTFKHCVWVRAGGGVPWHDLVTWAVASGYGGLENLSLIPGTVGAAPIQNIGAYGVELKDVFVRLEAVDLQSGQRRFFRHADCRFGYRDSIFKGVLKGKYAITRVTLRLHKSPHRLKLGYGDLQRQLSGSGVQKPSIADVAEAVIAIRRSKLPDPALLGNCGSFFKNPEISQEDWARLQASWPDAPHFPLAQGRIKVPAGWLIEQCGWKGHREGSVGVYERQALVLVNLGGATGAAVAALAAAIQASVQEKFGISLEAEVNLI
jgi:UDP-N-acetylmuramate dehydrogenase